MPVHQVRASIEEKCTTPYYTLIIFQRKSSHKTNHHNYVNENHTSNNSQSNIAITAHCMISKNSVIHLKTTKTHILDSDTQQIKVFEKLYLKEVNTHKYMQV